MKNTTVRILISAILLALLSGIIVVITGILLGGKTSTQFSDGFFWAGAILIAIGFVNFQGMHSQETGLEYSQSVTRVDPADRFKLWQADILHGYHLLAFLGISGLLLFGLAILAGGLF